MARSRAKRRYRRHYGRIIRRSKKFPIALGLGVGGGLALATLNAANQAMGVSGGAAVKGNVFFDVLSQNLFGYSPMRNSANLAAAKMFWFPAGAGIATHIIASKLGINRALAKALGVTL